MHAQCITLFDSKSYTCVSVVTYSTYVFLLMLVCGMYTYMYCMHTSIQSELADSPEVYDKFLKVLMDSDDSGLTPVEVCVVYSVYAHIYLRTMYTHPHSSLILRMSVY